MCDYDFDSMQLKLQSAMILTGVTVWNSQVLHIKELSLPSLKSQPFLVAPFSPSYILLLFQHSHPLASVYAIPSSMYSSLQKKRKKKSCLPLLHV